MNEIGQQDSVFVAAVKEAGQSNFAAEINLTQQAVSKMVKTKDKCPAEYVIPLERATHGKFPRHVIRPDLFSTPPGSPQ